MNLALFHEIIAEQTRVPNELFPLIALHRVSLDDLDAGDGLRKPCVHRAKLLAAGVAHWFKSPVIIVYRDHKQDDKDRGDKQQLRIDAADHHDGHDDGHQRINDEHPSRTEHKVKHSHIVGGARHDVPYTLLAVKGLALAQQADVEFVACIALNALTQEYTGVAPRQPRQRLDSSCRYHT